MQYNSGRINYEKKFKFSSAQADNGSEIEMPAKTYTGTRIWKIRNEIKHRHQVQILEKTGNRVLFQQFWED